MKAIVNTEYGSPKVLQLKEVEKPTPNDNEVLIKVHATTVNRTDTVFGLSAENVGAHAEYLCLPENGSVALKPTNMTYEQAAAICEGAYLALNYYKAANLQAGHKILINGTTGSIGSAGVQLAKYFGAEITAVANTKNMDLVKSLGAHKKQ